MVELLDKELQQLLELAINAAQKAGAYIAKQKVAELTINKKEGAATLASQVVTEVDLKAQEIILDELKATFNEYNLGLLTEESVDDSSRFEKDYFWCIDPLDGTLSFIEGGKGYAVSIALVSKHGEAVLGVVYNPVLNNLYSAVKNGGAYFNGENFVVSKQANFTFSTDRSFMNNPNFNKIVDRLRVYGKSIGAERFVLEKTSGAVINACRVIESAPACYFKFPKQENGGGSLWDFAASACIVKEAGGLVSDIFGNKLDLNRPESTFMNHRGILYASNQKTANFIRKLYDAYC